MLVLLCHSTKPKAISPAQHIVHGPRPTVSLSLSLSRLVRNDRRQYFLLLLTAHGVCVCVYVCVCMCCITFLWRALCKKTGSFKIVYKVQFIKRFHLLDSLSLCVYAQCSRSATPNVHLIVIYSNSFQQRRRATQNWCSTTN